MEHSLPLLINYIQGILDQTKASSFRREDLSPDFRELGDKIALLADRVQDLTNQLQQKNEIGRAHV